MTVHEVNEWLGIYRAYYNDSNYAAAADRVYESYYFDTKSLKRAKLKAAPRYTNHLVRFVKEEILKIDNSNLNIRIINPSYSKSQLVINDQYKIYINSTVGMNAIRTYGTNRNFELPGTYKILRGQIITHPVIVQEDSDHLKAITNFYNKRVRSGFVVGGIYMRSWSMPFLYVYCINNEGEYCFKKHHSEFGIEEVCSDFKIQQWIEHPNTYLYESDINPESLNCDLSYIGRISDQSIIGKVCPPEYSHLVK